MSERENPLHVRVAEALGCKPEHLPEWGSEYWRCTCQRDFEWPHGSIEHGAIVPALAPYDSDWAATGPLVEKYHLALDPPSTLIKRPWTAYVRGSNVEMLYGKGDTALLAICNLILALHAAGKLKEAV